MAEANNNSAPIAEVAALSIEPVATFKDQFKAFSKFGDTKSDGKLITLSQSDKWMKQSKVNSQKHFSNYKV